MVLSAAVLAPIVVALVFGLALIWVMTTSTTKKPSAQAPDDGSVSRTQTQTPKPSTKPGAVHLDASKGSVKESDKSGTAVSGGADDCACGSPPAGGCGCGTTAGGCTGAGAGAGAGAGGQTGSSAKLNAVSLRIIYGTVTNTAKGYAEKLEKEAFAMNVSGFHFDTSVVNMKDYDQDNLEQENLVIILMSTWEGGVPPPGCEPFYQWLDDMANDFRVPNTLLSRVRFAIFGLGSSVYDERFCLAAQQMFANLSKLGATPACGLGKGDDTADMGVQFEAWTGAMWPAMCEQYARQKGIDQALADAASAEGGCSGCGTSKETGSDTTYKIKGSWEDMERRNRDRDAAELAQAAGPGVRELRGKPKHVGKKPKAPRPVVPLTEEDLLNETMLMEGEEEEDDAAGGGAGGGAGAGAGAGTGAGSGDELMDMEDLGAVIKSHADEAKLPKEAREMVTPAQRAALTKERYRIIGTHSAVKLCRWTKHQLRGRGGCYKHTCYGITSYQCMETTPSLACANKCVFCWRHHKNPVGREWRWKTDDPEMIVTQAIEKHQKMIKECRGVPGVKMDRWNAAFTVKHCALSLVGEPIMYPHINKLLSLLHEREISTFLVTNAQFPEHIVKLEPVTQLYVSIDAATKETLRAVDRPLFRDFWERFLSSLAALRDKGQRTVYRLTLVKTWNMEEVDEYCKLIGVGQPDFIEIKAVTYSGKSDASSLTMKNVPYHEEVRAFSEAVCKNVEGYDLACEHEHSNLVLLAKKQFKIEGEWHTWIDYPKFHALYKAYQETGQTFSAMEYIAKTPDWAVYNAPEKGFDPVETRFRRTKTGKTVEDKYEASESGCG